MSDTGAGIPIGISIGFGGGFATGIAAGIASGKKQGQADLLERIRSTILTHGISIRASDGTLLPTEDFIREVLPDSPQPGRTSLAMILAGVILLLGLAVLGLFLFLRS